MLGGAGYAFPKDYLQKFPEAALDVVEIDPQLTVLARKYFQLKDDPRLRIYHEDGRVFLNRTDHKYDIILGDAFNALSALPYQLTTQEAVLRMYDILQEEGVALINIISAVEGRKGEFLRAEYATYKSIFPHVYLFPVDNADDGHEVQGVILVALKSKRRPYFESHKPEINRYLSHLWKKDVQKDKAILTDDFAPVEYYIGKAMLR